MADQPTTVIAGEPLALLEQVFDRLTYEVEECGCISVTGRLPKPLGDALERALRTVEFEMLERGIEPYSGPRTHPFDELMVRVVAARPDP